jgi:hypothetical protein
MKAKEKGEQKRHNIREYRETIGKMGNEFYESKNIHKKKQKQNKTHFL